VKRIALITTFLITPFLHADNWPQWRGPHNDGVSKEKGLPATWSMTKNLAWKLDLPGKGASTPVIWGDRIFLTGSENADLMLWCISSTKGTLLWKKKIATETAASYRKDESNQASPSPSTDGKNVFVFTGSGDFKSFDYDGNEVWHFNVQERYQKKFSMYHGIHVTPWLHEDRLYMNLIHTNGHWVFAVEKATGKQVWKIDRPSDAIGESRESYASPCLWKNNGEWNVVVLGADYTTGHRISDGKEVWRLTDLNPKGPKYSNALRIIASPVASADQLYVPTARNGLFVTLKQGASGTIKAGGQHEAWRIVKGAPDVPSPLYHDGLVYLQGADGFMSVVDAKSGNLVYREEVTRERYRASPTYADGKIYVIGRDSSTVTVLQAGPKFKVLGTNVMAGDPIPGSPVVSNGRLYIRAFTTLYAISEGGK